MTPLSQEIQGFINPIGPDTWRQYNLNEDRKNKVQHKFIYSHKATGISLAFKKKCFDVGQIKSALHCHSHDLKEFKMIYSESDSTF